jgi:UDP-N-acetylglucosamine 2-epimerase (non-hydrolysing)
MKKLKVMTVVGTRPEIIRLSRVLARLDEHCEHVLVHTGQNYDYELNQVFFDDLGVRKPDYFLNSAEGSSSAAHTIGNLIIAVDQILAKVQPEAMLVLGDTNSCLSVIPAKRRKIPIFHMEAGNRCFDQRVPEETNRRIVDHTADINLTYSTIARDYLLREGLPPDMIIKTGSPMFEVLAHYRPRIDASDVLTRLGLTEGEYFVVSAHREENIDPPQAFTKLVAVLNAVAEDHDLPVIVSTHPRTQKRIDVTDAKFHPKVRLLKPLGFHDYVKLQLSSRASLSDSGTIN